MSAAVLLGLAAAAGYGISDYLWRFAGRTVGVWRSVFYGNLLGLAALSAWIAVAHGRAPDWAGRAGAWCAAFGSALILMAGAGLFTQGLIKGTLAVVAPVTASYGAITSVLSMATGETLSRRVLIGLLATVAGVCLISAPPDAGRQFRQHLHSSGFTWALGAAVAYGVGLWLQGALAVPALGPLVPIWLYYGVSTALIPLFAGRESWVPPPRRLLIRVLASGALYSAAYVALTVGLATGRIAVVVVLSTLASAVTVLLSRFLDGARVAAHQWAAIAVIVAGLTLIRA